jgi:small redox-active disulfide protein 2
MGCPNCLELEKRAKEAVKQLGIKAEIEKVTDITEIMAYGVMSTPALVVDKKVVVSGKVPSVEDLKKLIRGK